MRCIHVHAQNQLSCIRNPVRERTVTTTLSVIRNHVERSMAQEVVLCFASYGYTLINQRTTPFTMLAIALQRFFHVCRPFDVQTETYKKCQSAGFILMTSLFVVVLSGEWIYIVHEHFFWQNSPESGSVQWACKRGVIKDVTSLYIVYGGLCFILPATICCFLYAKVIIGLKKMAAQRERNRQLTILFIITCFLWIVFWTPEKIHRLYVEPSGEILSMGVIKPLLNQFHNLITLSFSAVQPIILTLSYRPFYETIVANSRKVKSLFLSLCERE